MADNPASNLAQGAKRGVSAMPKWAWIAIIGAGLVAGVLFMRRSSSGAAAAAAAAPTTADNSTGMATPASYVPVDNGGSNNPYGDPYGPGGPSVVSVPSAAGASQSQQTSGDSSPISDAHSVTATAPPPQPVSITLMTGGGPPTTQQPGQQHSANYHPNAAKGNKYRWTDGKWHKTPQPGQKYF